MNLASVANEELCLKLWDLSVIFLCLLMKPILVGKIDGFILQLGESFHCLFFFLEDMSSSAQGTLNHLYYLLNGIVFSSHWSFTL